MKRVLIEALGWLLVIAGLAALVLPGPGMLMLFGGLALLAQCYPWAHRLLHPVRVRALVGAAEGVETWPRMIASLFGIGWLVACGLLWLVQPPAPGWWRWRPEWWLLGGRSVGVTLLVSALLGLGLFVYSVRRFRGHPDEVAEVHALQRAHQKAVALRRERRHRSRANRSGT